MMVALARRAITPLNGSAVGLWCDRCKEETSTALLHVGMVWVALCEPCSRAVECEE